MSTTRNGYCVEACTTEEKDLGHFEDVLEDHLRMGILTGSKLLNEAIALVCVFVAGDPAIAKDEPAPDGKMIAVITDDIPRSCEVHIVLRMIDGQKVFEKKYISEDGQHGYCVGQTAWTPDSQFFVFNLISSGGHQPWHVPVMVFSRYTTTLTSLDDRLPDPITDENFSVFDPDIVQVVTTQLPLGEHQPVTRRIALRELLAQ